jgi:sugar/nucleoside kinase (ribokinase family)
LDTATPLNTSLADLRYHALIGTGGIGSGRFFALKGNHTLGREESRSGYFLNRKDYCKLHIIAHYVKVLLGPSFEVFPIGKVGDDDLGVEILKEMQETGYDMRYVAVSPGDATLYSICFTYPDGSGGNLTAADSACSKVDAGFIEQARTQFERFRGRGVALAAPEVPLEARKRLLELATEFSFFRVASFTAEEIASVSQMGLFPNIDLLGINLNEARAVVGIEGEEGPALPVVETAVQRLLRWQPEMLISVTSGKQGSWCWDGVSIRYVPAFLVQVAGTAGAGDAHLSGMITGLAAGLVPGEAHELATLIAALSVTSPHTIHKGIDSNSLREFRLGISFPFSEAVDRLLELS